MFVLAPVIGGLFFFIDSGIGIYFWGLSSNLGRCIRGFKSYLIESVTSIWATDVDIHTLGQCAEVWRASRKYTMAFCLLLSFLYTIARLTEMEDASAIGSSISVYP